MHMMWSLWIHMVVATTKELPIAVTAHHEADWTFAPKDVPTAEHSKMRVGK